MILSAEAETKKEGSKDFDLVIQDDLISLDARDASLKEIVEEIGRRMDIEVDAQIGEDEKVTEQFEKLSLEEALDRLSANYAYLLDPDKEKGKIKKIVLLSKGSEGKGMIMSRPSPTTQSQQVEEKAEQTEERPEPFKFEFDPSKYLDKGK
jgi:hypothetical protein